MSNTLRQKLVKNRIVDRLCQKYIERREQRNEWAKTQKRRLSVHSIKDSIGSVLATATQPNEIFVDIKGNSQLAEKKTPTPKPRKRKKSHEEQVLDMVKIRLQLFILFFIVFFIILPAGMLYLMENLFLGNKRWTFVSTLYYVIITLSTVGLGDFVPTIQPGAHGTDTTSEHQQEKLVEDHIDDDNFVSINQQNLTLAFTNTSPFSLKEALQNSGGEDLTFIPNKGYVQYKSIKDITYTEILIHVYCMTYAMLIFVWILFGLVYMKLSSDIICETMQRKIIKRTEDFQHLKQEVKNLALQSSSLKASEKFRMLTKNLTASKIRGTVASLDKKVDNTGKPSTDKVQSNKLRNTVVPLTNPRLKPGIEDLLVKIKIEKQKNENEPVTSKTV